MTSFEIKTDCVAMVDDYLEAESMPETWSELLRAIRFIMDLYELGCEYVGPLAYEFEYRTHACFSTGMDCKALEAMGEAMNAELPSFNQMIH